MKFLLYLLISLVWIGVLCGCGVGRPMLITDEPAFRQVKEHYPVPLAYKIGVVAKVWAREGSDKFVNSDELSREVAAVLDGSIFKKAAIGVQEGEHNLKLDMLDFELKYAGRSGATVPCLLLWTLATPLACMLVGDEVYTASGRVSAVLEDDSGRKLWNAEFEVGTECNISDVQRGWTVWDLYVPGPFRARPNVKEASNHVLPHFYRDVQLKLLEAIRENPFPPPEIDCAIVIGVGKFSEDIAASTRYTVQDAQAVGRLLKERGGTYLEGTTTEFTGEVTAEEILQELEQLSKRRDVQLRNVLVYYAGCGQVVGEEGNLKHQLLTSTEPLDLTELVGKLSALECSSCVLILDCGFSGKDDRCVPFEGATTPKYPDEVLKSEKVGILFACEPGQSAAEDSNAGHGVFTSVVLEYLEQLPVAQKVTLKELSQQIGFKVSRRARECGAERQEPVRNTADAILFPKKPSLPRQEQ